MHAQLFTLATAAAALLLPSVALASSGSGADGHVVRDAASPRLHRSRAKLVQKRSNNMPSGWSMTAACLSDAAAPNRLLAQSSNFMSTLTPAVCAQNCESKGFSYAAVQDGHECWCASSLNYGAKAGVKVDVSQCNMPCTGDANQNCGGFYTLSLFSKNGNSTSHPTTSASVKPTSSVSQAHSTSKAPASSTSKAASTSTPPSSSKFKLVEDMSGNGFFNHFNFFTAPDPTGGQVKYVSASTAKSSKLAFVDNNQAIMKVDSSTWLASGAPRQSVRVTSNKAYASGLMIFDIDQMPFGCSVWPAMWTVGPNWPSGGEIDIIEGVNNKTINQLTLHTAGDSTCSTKSVPKTAVSTDPMGVTCASTPDSNAGCAWKDDSPSAYGAGFNKAGGAVFALQIDPEAGVFIYKWSHDKVPEDITSGSPNPGSDAWGTPQAEWPSANGCKTSDVIKPQNIVFDITLCGGWCSSDYPNSGCPGKCEDQIMDPANYVNAKWVVNSVKIYQ